MKTTTRLSFSLVNAVSTIIGFVRNNMGKVAFLFVMMSATSVNAQGNKTIKDTVRVQELEAVTITSGTNYQVQKTYLNPKTYYRSVQLQETSPGQQSPYLGGFTGNQVDQSINGIRINNGLFRTGPNQYFGWVPMNFTKTISTSDGGNVGGTISREIGIDKSYVGLDYNGGNNAFSQTAFFKSKKFGIGVNNLKTGNIRTPEGIIEHSAYNQKALIGEIYWKPNIKTTAVFSQSDTLERTDRWNGGMRESGLQAPRVYTWDLQRFIFVNHKMILKDLSLNFSYQNFSENINDNNKPINTRLNSFTANGDYRIADDISIYSSNVVELIDYKTTTTSVQNDLYSTFKQGFRFNKTKGDLSVYYSLGWRRVKIENLNPFDGVETSLILGYRGLFGNFTRSLNAPSFLMIKQSITTGKATQIPNENLTQESSNTIRVGYKKKGIYVDASYRRLENAFVNIFINPDTIQTVNVGYANIFSSTLGYTDQNLFDKGIGIDTRMEYIYGINSEEQPINKTVPFSGYLKLTYKGFLVEGRFQTKDDLLSEDDLNDVRVYSHNKGLRLVNLGYENSFKNFNYGVLFYNILNDVGRIYGSSVDVPMRSIQVNLKYNF
jgi:hypothetical protein